MPNHEKLSTAAREALDLVDAEYAPRAAPPNLTLTSQQQVLVLEKFGAWGFAKPRGGDKARDDAVCLLLSWGLIGAKAMVSAFGKTYALELPWRSAWRVLESVTAAARLSRVTDWVLGDFTLDSNTRPLQFGGVDRGLIKRLKVYAAANDVSMTDIAVLVLTKFLDERGAAAAKTETPVRVAR